MMAASKLLKAFQNRLGASRESCDIDDVTTWDEIDIAINEIEALKDNYDLQECYVTSLKQEYDELKKAEAKFNQFIEHIENTVTRDTTVLYKNYARRMLVQVYYEGIGIPSDREKMFSYLMDIVNDDSDIDTIFKTLNILVAHLREKAGLGECIYDIESAERPKVLFHFLVGIMSAIERNISCTSHSMYKILLKEIAEFVLLLNNLQETEIDILEAKATEILDTYNSVESDLKTAQERVDFMYSELISICENGLHKAYVEFNDYLPDFWAHLSGIKEERDLQIKIFKEDPRFESVADAIEKNFGNKLSK